MDQQILAFSGYKQSGKDTACNFLLRNQHELFSHLIEYAKFSELCLLTNKMKPVLVRKFAFADALKQFLHEYFDIPLDHLYGTDEQKNSLTPYKWEDMPHYLYITREYEARIAQLHRESAMTTDPNEREECIKAAWKLRTKGLPSGFMTARDMLQQMGTEVMRRIHGPIWVNKTLSTIKASGVPLAVICDLRFPNEFEAVKAAGGKVARLTRNPAGTIPHEFHGLKFMIGGSDHPSERSMDPDKFDWNRFDMVLNNAEHDIDTTHRTLVNVLRQWGWTT